MKWPWVSREIVDLLHHELDRERAGADAAGMRATLAADRYAALLEQYHELRQSGAVSSAVTLRSSPPRIPDPVSLAVVAKSRGHPTMARHYSEYVAMRRADRAAGLTDETEEELAASILRGGDDDTGVPL